MLETLTFTENMHHLHERPKIGLFDFELKTMLVYSQFWIIFASVTKWFYLLVLINLRWNLIKRTL